MPLPPQTPSPAPRPPCWSCLTTLSSVWCVCLLVPFGSVLPGPPPEDIKSTERGCSDMLKCCSEGRGHGRRQSWSTMLGAGQRCLGGEAAWCSAGHCRQHSECLVPSEVPSTGRGARDGLILLLSLHQVYLSLSVMTPLPWTHPLMTHPLP